MKEVSIIGLDLAKNVFQAHGAAADGSVVFRRKLSRGQLVRFFSAQPSCLVVMEACASAHYWARTIGALGHTVKLIPPAYVKPFVKRQKNDAADAEAIAEAAARPTMRFVAPKSEAQQAAAMAYRTRDLLVRQRTQTNQRAPRASRRIRGWWRPTGVAHVGRLAASGSHRRQHCESDQAIKRCDRCRRTQPERDVNREGRKRAENGGGNETRPQFSF